MARIQAAHFCELAFLDNCNRLCLIGLTTRFPVPSLPIVVRRMMVALHVVDVAIGDELGVIVSMVPPSGHATTPPNEFIDVGIAGDYLLITLHDVPLSEEGMHRILVSLDDKDPVALDVGVFVAGRSEPATLH